MIRPRLTPSRGIAALVAVTMMAMPLAACSSSNSSMQSSYGTTAACPNAPDSSKVAASTQPLAIVDAQRRNSSPQATLPDSLCLAIIAAVKGSATITVVRLDGQPTIVGTTKFTTKAKNGPAREQARDGYAAGVEGAVLRVRALTPHVNVQQAVSVAAGKLRDALVAGDGQMFVLGSILQEVGTPNFTASGMLIADPAEVAAFMTAHKLVPDLNHVAVTFVGATFTADPQVGLDSALQSNVVNIWTAIAHAGHAASVRFLSPAQSGNAVPDAKTLPAVSLVPVPKVPIWNPNQIYPDSGPLGYKPELAVLLDPKSARTALSPVPGWMLANPSCKLIITGTTARVGQKAGQVALGHDRARVAKSIIVGLGGNAARIIIKGVGSYFPGYVADHDPRTHELLPAQAQANRTVRFAPSCSSGS